MGKANILNLSVLGESRGLWIPGAPPQVKNRNTLPCGANKDKEQYTKYVPNGIQSNRYQQQHRKKQRARERASRIYTSWWGAELGTRCSSVGTGSSLGTGGGGV